MSKAKSGPDLFVGARMELVARVLPDELVQRREVGSRDRHFPREHEVDGPVDFLPADLLRHVQLFGGAIEHDPFVY